MNAFTFLLLTATPGTAPMNEVLRHDFAGGVVSEPLLRYVGREPKRFVHAHPSGLRITLPGKEALPPTGVASRLAVHGDFEITATYQLLKVGKPSRGYGAGVSLWISTTSPRGDAATLARAVRPREGDVLVTDHGFQESEGKRKHDQAYLPTNAKGGKLRLARSGSTLIYLASAGGDTEFQELRRVELGSASLQAVRFAADTGGAATEVDVLLVDLEIRSSELSASPVSRQQASATYRLWIVGLGIAVALVVGGFLFRQRRLRAGRGVVRRPQ